MAWYRSIYPLLVIAWAIVFIILFSYYCPGTSFDIAYSILVRWSIIMGSVVIAVGLINITINSVREVKKRAPGRWHLAIWQLLLIAITLISGFAQGKGSPTTPGTIINWLFSNFYRYGDLAIFALMGFWMLTAAFRAFRARNLETFLFVFGAFFTLLRNAPIGGLIWRGFPVIGQWLLSVPYIAVQRALLIGIGVGILTYAARYFIGKEKAAFGRVE